MTIVKIVEIFLVQDSGGSTVNHPEVAHSLSQGIPEKAQHDDYENHIQGYPEVVFFLKFRHSHIKIHSGPSRPRWNALPRSAPACPKDPAQTGVRLDAVRGWRGFFELKGFLRTPELHLSYPVWNITPKSSNMAGLNALPYWSSVVLRIEAGIYPASMNYVLTSILSDIPRLIQMIPFCA
jgi:hypothetical protein